LGATLVACTRPEPELYSLRVMGIDAHGGPSLPEDRVRAIVRRSLEQAPSFTVAERDQRSGKHGDTLMATFEYRELPDASDHGRDLMVRMLVEIPDALAQDLGPEGLDVTVLLERAAGQADLAHDLQLATDRVATVLQARTDVARKQPGVVGRLLASDDRELILLALAWVRDHRDETQAQASADRVAELVRDPDEQIGLLAIEALGKIGGPEHVPTLLERISLGDGEQVRLAYDALAQLGGPEAHGFLEFAARNEDQPERRAAAERALRRVAESDIVEPSGRGPDRGHR
jgi:hypothetical protein